MRRYLALDIETVPDERLVAAVDGEPTRPYADQLGRLLAARRAQSGGRSDFLPLPYHRPVAACWLEASEGAGGAILPERLGAWRDGDCPEREFLAQIWDALSGRTLVTFHGRGFDLPVLELRSLKLGLAVPGGLAARGAPGAEHHDLFELLATGGATPSSLDLYAKLVGLPGKEDVAGKDVSALYARRELSRIAGYCMSDVLQTWLLYLRYRLREGTLSAPTYTRSVLATREVLPRLLAQALDPEARTQLHGFVDRCGSFFDELPAVAVALQRAR